jgi:glycosyltransferase involved in cell wall biosynthesis
LLVYCSLALRINDLDGWVIAYVLVFCGLWVWFYLEAARHLLLCPRLNESRSPAPENWPSLSVIIAARDEADTIREALTSLLQEDYPKVEFIVVNDRSSDATGAIIEAMAASDPRVRAIHIDALPNGWLGKVHALHRGSQAASGEWLLFTDADVHFARGTLRESLALAIAQGYDHLALLPGLKLTGSVWLEAIIAAFLMGFMRATKPADLDKNPKAMIGVGAFNLVKRTAFENTEGFSWLRLEVVDDVGLGMMIKQAGGESGFVMAQQHLGIAWYPSVAAMFRGLEKNLFGGAARYRYWRTAAMAVLSCLLFAAPLVALIRTDISHLWLAGVLAYAVSSLSAVMVWRRLGVSLGPGLLTPIGQLLITCMLLYSTFRCWRQNGIAWRGTVYSLKELRGGQRVVF